MWPQIALAALQGFAGMQAAKRRQDQTRRYNLAQSEMTRYSPWTGQSGQLSDNYGPGELGGAISGAASGWAFGQGIDNTMNKAATTNTTNPTSTPDTFKTTPIDTSTVGGNNAEMLRLDHPEQMEGYLYGGSYGDILRRGMNRNPFITG